MSKIERLLDVMARLRDSERGCPWDREQSFATIAPYTIEEAYEVADAIAAQDLDALREELGDLLFQIVFHARMAQEAGAFGFDDVAETICEKMIRRHPHVFADGKIDTADAQTDAWEHHKSAERALRALRDRRAPSLLDGVARGLPALSRAVKLQTRAARAGFDWREIAPLFMKLEEEIAELRQAVVESAEGRIEDEIGDLLFMCTNLARHLKVDPESALRGANAKFERRFRRIEEALAAQGRTPDDASLDEMETLWEKAKSEERPS